MNIHRAARLRLAFSLVALVWACSACTDGASRHSLGFFTPRGLPAQLVPKTQFGMIAGYSAQQVDASLAQAAGTSFRLHIDFGPTIAEVATSGSVKTRYQRADGDMADKAFAPLPVTKLRVFPDDARLASKLAPFIEVMARHRENVGAIFLADEPYLNGIPKSEMERAGRVARSLLDAAGLTKVQLGVIFAGAMFNRDFARFMEQQAARHVEGIDAFYRDNPGLLDPGNVAQAAIDFRTWVQAIRANRLSTYDTAGNMYSEGGVPEGFEVVGFDFYLSTILLDGIHESTLDWFARNTGVASCRQFAGTSMRNLRAQLSFFKDGDANRRAQQGDKALLDAVFDCRMRATTELLEAATKGSSARLMMISESSSNGVLEFDAQSRPLARQPSQQVESRVLDEVQRAQAFYSPQRFGAGLMFFTYQDEYDDSIRLKILGAEGMPRVLARIFDFAR